MKKKKIRKICFVGASSVLGQHDYEGGGFVNRFARWWEVKNTRNIVYNLGVSGDTTEEMLKRVDLELKVRKPDLVVFSFGNNDSSRLNEEEKVYRVFLEKYKENIEKLLNKALVFTENIAVFGVYPIDDKKTDPLSWVNISYLLYDVISYDNAVAEICDELNVLYYENMSNWLKRGYMDLLSEDGLHANSVGHEILSNDLQKFLSDNFELNEQDNDSQI